MYFVASFLWTLSYLYLQHGCKAEPEYSESHEDDNGHGVTAEPVYSESDEDDIRATSSKDEVLDTDNGIDR